MLNDNLRLHLKRLKRRALLNVIALIIVISTIGIGLLFIFTSLFKDGIILLVASLPFVIYLVFSSKRVKKEIKVIHNPIIIELKRSLSFNDLVDALESLTTESERLSLSDDIRFYHFKNNFKSRVILYHTNDFNKKDFDKQKARINQKANKQFGSKKWFGRSEINTYMRFNVIYATEANDELTAFFSHNSQQNLSRAEGIFNIAVIDNEIIIPPLYGNCYYEEIRRYEKIIKLIDNDK